MAPDLLDVRVTCPENPITIGWEGGAVVGRDSAWMKDKSVTRKEYEEHGSRICVKKFAL